MLRRRLFLFPSLYLLLAFAFPITLAAQATTGIIRGVVVDATGDPVDGARVVLRETRTGFARSLNTLSNGVFVASLLPLGMYDLTIRQVGLQEYQQTGIELRVGATINVAVRLPAAVTLEALVIRATPPAVDPTRTENASRLPDEVVSGLPNNGRNFLNLTLLTPNVAIVQGPDGDELTVAGQRGIHNNVSVDGADFNNPFFGEQRGGQRPAFTFNLDAVQEMVVVAGGANAEFGRSSGGFINVITKSGTNEIHGTLHYLGKYDALSADPRHESPAGIQTFKPDFNQHQFGFTLGGPLVRDKAFFFLAYDHQLFDEVKQTDPLRIADPDLRAWMDTAFGGALASDFGPISRTNDARAGLAKLDIRLGNKHNFSLKYNHTWSEQKNGTFDVDTWGLSANGLEKSFSNAINGSLVSFLSSDISNEFRFQYSREDRPRAYPGPTSSGLTPGDPTGTGTDRPFPDTAMDFANGFRFGLPFFLPIEYYDTRIQLLNNISFARGNHLIKFGAEWNRVESVQTFIGFANGRFIFSSVPGFLNYVANGSGYVECSDGSTSTTATCPAGEEITGPILLYLQQAGVGQSVIDAGTQSIPQHELAVFLQDTWKPSPNLTLNYGLRWAAQIQPDPITPPSQVFFQPFIGQTGFPSDGTIPSDWNMFQPRLGFAWDVDGTGRTVLRGSAGIYYARIPGLNIASTRSTNGSVGQTLFRNSALIPILGRPPAYDSLLTPPSGTPFFPGVFVFDKDFENPRTISATIGFERVLALDLSGLVSYTHSRTDNLTRFINRNDAVFGSPWSTGLEPGGANGINTLTVVESSAKSRYNAVTVGLKYKRLADPDALRFEVNYTVSFDKSDDDNERDPFTFRYARPDRLDADYNWSDRDQRHRVNGWLLARLPGQFYLNNRVSFYSAQPVSVSCGPSPFSVFAPPAGQRIVNGEVDRNCADGSVLQRNTLRKDNEFFSWDIRLTRVFDVGQSSRVELFIEVFNVTNSDNFRDPAATSLLFNFDGTIRSGQGEPRQAQIGTRVIF